eukprot:1131184-Rhodomonas_salina.1
MAYVITGQRLAKGSSIPDFSTGQYRHRVARGTGIPRVRTGYPTPDPPTPDPPTPDPRRPERAEAGRREGAEGGRG